MRPFRVLAAFLLASAWLSAVPARSAVSASTYVGGREVINVKGEKADFFSKSGSGRVETPVDITQKQFQPRGFMLHPTASTTGAPAYQFPEAMRIMLAQNEARLMSATEVVAAEAAVSASPFDVMTRARLLGYYNTHGSETLEARIRRRDHILWLVRNRPDSPAASNDATKMWEFADGKDAVRALKAEWVRQVSSHDGSTIILDRAAEAMEIQDPAQSLTWLADAERIAPRDPHWAKRVGFRNYLDANQAEDAGARYAAASRSLAAYERAMALTPLVQDRLAYLDEAALDAYWVNRDDKAEQFARQRLKATEAGSWDFGNAVNHANTVLGLVALRKKDLKAARDFLGQSGAIKGSPQLNSFGPDFRLAKAMLDAGQRDAVDDYLEACEGFWEMGKDRLARWRKELAAGQTPDFSQYK